MYKVSILCHDLRLVMLTYHAELDVHWFGQKGRICFARDTEKVVNGCVETS